MNKTPIRNDISMRERLKKGAFWEMLSACVLGFGLFMLMQPWSQWLFSYSFNMVLLGVIGFSISLKLPQE